MADSNFKIAISVLDKTAKGLKSARRGINFVAGSILNLKTALAGAAFTLLVRQSLLATDSLSKTASKIGTTTESLGALRYAANLTGVATNTMDMALQRFTRRTAEAANGTGEAKEAIKKLGLNARELVNMPLEERMLALADAFGKETNEAEKLALAFKLFDSEGAALVNMLSGGSEAMKEMLGEAKALGLAMSGSAAKGVEDTVDALTKMQGLFKGVTDQTVAAFAPAMEMMVERFTAFLQRSIEAKGGIESFARSLAINLLKGIKLALIGFQELANGFIKVYNNSIKVKNELKNAFGLGLKSSEEYRKGLDSLAAQIEGIKNTTNTSVTAQLDATDLLVERRKKLLELYHKAQDAEAEGNTPDVDLLSGFITQINDSISGLENFKATASTIAAAVVPPINNIDLGFQAFKKTVLDSDQIVQSFTTSALNGMTDALTAGITGAANFADAMKSMAKSVVDSLIKMLIQKYIVDAAFGAISGAITGGVTSTTDFNAAGPMQPRAIGGSVQNGSPYMVGERGPELFIPNSQGSIVPNSRMGGGGGVTVNQTINVSTGVQQTVRAEIATLMPQIANAAKGAVADARQRGGGFSKSLVGA